MRAVGGDAAGASVRGSQSDRGLHLVVLLVSILLCTWLVAPANAYGIHAGGEVACNLCHQPHQATLSPSLLDVGDDSITTQVDICMFCHEVDATGAPLAPVEDINIGAAGSEVFPSGHRVESASATPDLTNDCSGCHNPHTETTKLPQMTINGLTVLIDDDPVTVDEPNTWCRACHDPDRPADENWSGFTGVGYYDQIFSSREADTYIGFGTFRGWAAYENTSAHASIPADPAEGRAEGDCLWCHERHSSTSTYDNLIAEFGPTSKAACDECHDDHLLLNPAGDWGTGHFVEQGPLVVGDSDGKVPLPCYECHNAHGSRNGNTKLAQDSLGQLLNPDSESAILLMETARFCYTCHLSSDGLGWNSWANDGAGAMQTYAQLVTAAETSDITTAVAGLLRTEMVELPSIKAHGSGEMDKLGCKCHGSVHAPNPDGVSPGGVACYECHATYESYMEHGGANSTTVYHHVMGTGTGDGGTAFAAGSYPTSTSNLYCMSCHADHDRFNDHQAANLRLDLSSAATTSTTDYVSTGTYGICISCHAMSLEKDNANQKPEAGATATPKIVGGAGAGGFGTPGGVVAHDYIATSTFGDLTTFGANCSKCHNDEQTKDFQTSDDRFGTHYSAARRLLSALGGTVNDPLAESHCYRCHSEAEGLTGGKTASEAGRDWYDAADMSAAAEDVYDQFQLAGSKHPVAATASGSVECESCHNVHVVRNTTGGFVNDPLNTYDLASYSTTQQQADYCLNCHDSDGGPTRQVDDSVYVPHAVSLTAAGMDKETYGERGHWNANGAISTTETQSCAVCHDNHGSTNPKLLGARDAINDVNSIDNGVAEVTITANDRQVCFACHTSASTGSGPTGYIRVPNGYPDEATWPGKTVYEEPANNTGIHRNISTSSGSITQYGVTLPSYPTAGDCKICHDVHGTTNAYDALRGITTPAARDSFSSSNFTVCFVCHDGSPSTRDVYQYYPSSAGGAPANTARRYGHAGSDTVGTVPNRVLPCYDCHNPHGSSVADGIRVETMDSATNKFVVEIAYSSGNASSVRNFCFTCHLPYDTNNGYNGSSYSEVTEGAKVDGFDRINDLKINWSSMPHRESRPNSCISTGCHANPHYPE